MNTAQEIRVTVDVEADDCILLAELDESKVFHSKREIFLVGLRLVSFIYRARLSGAKTVLVGSDGVQHHGFDDQYLPVIVPEKNLRYISLAKTPNDTIRKLAAYARKNNDDLLESLARDLSVALNDPRGTLRVEAQVFSDLIALASGSPDPVLLAIVKDLLTQTFTEFESFTLMVEYAIHLQHPTLARRFVEQRFLDDHYKTAVKAAYGAN